MAEADLGREKHSGLRPQGGHVNNYKASQHVADESAVFTPQVSREPFF